MPLLDVQIAPGVIDDMTQNWPKGGSCILAAIGHMNLVRPIRLSLWISLGTTRKLLFLRPSLPFFLFFFCLIGSWEDISLHRAYKGQKMESACLRVKPTQRILDLEHEGKANPNSTVSAKHPPCLK